MLYEKRAAGKSNVTCLERPNERALISMHTTSMISALSLTLVTGLTLTTGCHHKHDGAAERDHHKMNVDHDRDHDESPEIGSGISTALATRRIASARCEREARCENIGADNDYASMDECEEKTKNEWAEDLNKYECPKGIREEGLNDCLTHIRDEDCGNPIDSVQRIFACKASDICDDG